MDPSCPYMQPALDKNNRQLCSAHTLTLQAAQAGCAFNDSTLTAASCATVDDEVCSGQSNWYRFQVRAKRIFAVVPDAPQLELTVYTSTTPAPSSESELDPLENGWRQSPFNYHRMYIVDGAKDALTDVWVRVVSPSPTPYTLVVKESDTALDCVDPRLVGRGNDYGYGLPGSDLEQGRFLGGLHDVAGAAANLSFNPNGDEIRTNSTACLKELADPDDASQGWAVMQAVACIDGELRVMHDCIAGYPSWDVADRAAYGELLCDMNTHPAGQLWCEPSGQRDDYHGVCELHGLSPGEPVCLDDPLTGDSRYLFGCQTNHGFLFESDSGLYNPSHLVERGYVTGVDCQDLRGESGPAASEAELARGRCGVDALTREVRCLLDREQADNLAAGALASFDAYDPARADFPNTQNLISCAHPGAGNSVPYATIDAFSGIYTDAHVREVAPQIAELQARGIQSYGYLNVPAPETKTTWQNARFLGNSAPWASMAYQYLFWSDGLGEFIGDPSGDYAPVPRNCIDVDGDGFGNIEDNCPTVYNAGVGGLQPDADGDGLGDACDPEPDAAADGDLDSDGLSQNGFADNCPETHNPVDAQSGKQADADNNGIGDACQSGATVWTCDETCRAQTNACGSSERDAGLCQESALMACAAEDGVACVDENGAPVVRGRMSWTFDLYHPTARRLLVAWTKLAALAGMDGMTFDLGFPPDCYGEALNTLFAQFLANQGHLERDLSGSSDPNDQARLEIYAAVVSEVGDPSSLDVAAYKTSLPEGDWHSSAVYRALALFKVDFMRMFMRDVRDGMTTFMAARRPGESFRTFFNQGTTTLFNSEADASAPDGYANLKDVAGAETFIRGGHAGHGVYDCVGVEGAVYPTNRTLEWQHSLHDDDGLRFWSWNFPGEIPDDRWPLFAAEALSRGGLAQTPFCSVEPLYPYSGYTTPNRTLRQAQASIAPFMSHQWQRLNLPRRRGQIAMYFPQTIEEACYNVPQFGFDAAERLYTYLHELHYTVDAIGGSGFGLGRTRVPDLGVLQGYDFIVLAAEFFSDAEIEAFEQYLSAGGTLVAAGMPGQYDEWCDNAASERPSWLSHFAQHGDNAVGSGHLYWLDDVGAYTRPDTSEILSASAALTFLHRPNAGTNICTPGGAACGENGGSFDTTQLVLQDLFAQRQLLRDWLETELIGTFGLPTPEFGGELPQDIHVSVRQDSGGLPVYHLVNYGLETVAVDPWFDGTLAGSYQSRVAHFSCTVPASVPALPVPPELQASGGVLHFAALDYAPPEADFFPNACGPATPCVSPPLNGSYPSADNGYAPATGSVNIAPGNTEVALTWGDGAPVTMKQWLIAWFEPSGA